jgi:hypothetical protein
VTQNHPATGIQLWFWNWIWLILLWAFVGCTNSRPVIHSLGLTSPQMSFVEALHNNGTLVGNTAGTFELDLICTSEMTSVQYSNSPSGPWTQLAQINCNSGKAHLAFQQVDNMNQTIYLRTHGPWGSSVARPVKLFYRMAVNLAGLPGDPSNNTDFSITLNGESLQSYRFSFGTNSQDCANESSYSPERSIDIPILASELGYTTIPDGRYRLCVLAKNHKQIWSHLDFAESREWTKDTIAPKANLTAINDQAINSIPASMDSNYSEPRFEFKSTKEDQSTVTLFLEPACSQKVVAEEIKNDLATLQMLSSSLKQGENTIYVQLKDRANNQTPCEKLIDYRLDSVKPEITSISGFANKLYGLNEVIEFDLNLSEPVQWNITQGPPALKIQIGDVTKEAIFIVAKSTAMKLHFEYVTKAGDNDSDGIRIQSPLFMPATDTIVDLFKNPLSTMFIAPSTSGVLVDTLAPYITKIEATTPNPWAASGQSISFLVTFSEQCQWQGVTQIDLPFTIGTSAFQTSCLIPGANANVLSCSYVVQNGNLDLDGIEVPAAAMILNGSLRDLAQNPAQLQTPATWFSNLKVDAIAPNVSALTINTPLRSTKLRQSPPITWNAATDSGSGLNKYTLKILDDNEDQVFTQDYTDPQSNLVLDNLALSDLTNSSKKYRTYSIKLIVSDGAGNESVITHTGWRVVQFSQGASIVHNSTIEGFGSKTAISSDGRRLLVSVKELRIVKVYIWSELNQSWLFQQDLADPGGTGSRFGIALGIHKLTNTSYLYAIGAPGDGTSSSGKVHLYKELSGTTTLSQTINHNSSQAGDEFGRSLDLVGDLLVIGAPGYDAFLANNAGALVSLTCQAPAGTCSPSGGGIGYEIANGSMSNQRLGELITATIQQGNSILYSSQLGSELTRYVYSPSDLAWLQIGCNSFSTCALWNSGPKIKYLDSYGDVIAASNGSSSAMISTDGGNFSILSGTNGAIGPITVFGDSNPDPQARIGTLIVAYDSDGQRVRLYKAASGSYYSKQTLSGLGDFSGGSFAGEGPKLLLGNPLQGIIYLFK